MANGTGEGDGLPAKAEGTPSPLVPPNAERKGPFAMLGSLGLLSMFERTVLSLWLILLYTSLIFFVVISFSAYQFHLSIKQAKTDDDQPISLSGIIDLRERWRSVETNLNFSYQSSNLNTIKASRNNNLISGYYTEQNKIYDECKKNIREVFKKYDGDTFNFYLVRCNKDDAEISKNRTTEAEKKSALDIVQGYSQKLNDIQSSIAFATSERNDALKELIRIDDDIDKLIKKKDAILQSSKIRGVSEFVGAADFFDPTRVSNPLQIFFPDFMIMPTDTLVLIIVISMGALGGAIQITRNFLSPEDLSNVDTYRIRYRYIFFQPFLGAITALAIFILFKAGVMVVSTNVGSSEDASLNPFFISFLGIISGLMANIALDTILKIGENWFRSSSTESKARWAVRLESVIEEQAKKYNNGDLNAVKAELKDYADIPDETLSGWIKQSEPVPFHFQKLLAIFFRKHEWELFTDVPLKPNSGAAV